MNKTILSVGAVTQAIKAKKLLGEVKINSQIIKLDSGGTLSGCIYGVMIDNRNYPNAALTLKKSGLSYSVFSQKN